MKITELQQVVVDFRDERDWEQFHNPKDLATAIAIEASELQEKFLWKSKEESYEIGKNDPDVADEMADIIAYVLSLAEVCNIDIAKAVLNKVEKNKKKYPVEKAKGKADKYNKL